MNTLNQIKVIMDAYIQRLKELKSLDEHNCQEQTDEAKRDVLSCFDLLAGISPELVQIVPYYTPMDEEVIIERLRINASNRYKLDYIPTLDCNRDVINGDVYYTPSFIPWQRDGNSKQNFVINYNNASKREAKDALNNLLLNMLISLPAKSVRLNVFDFNMTGLAELFTVGLESIFYNEEIVVDSSSACNRLKSLLDHMSIVMKKYGNLASYNDVHKEISMPYEVVVLNRYPNMYDQHMDMLLPLFENGARCGIYFIVMNNIDYDFIYEDKKSLLDIENYHEIELTSEDTEDGFVRYVPFSKRPLLIPKLMAYLNAEATKEVKREVLKQDFSALQQMEYEPIMSEISVTVGLDIENKNPVTLRFNSGDYIHAFILGQSGSGKSVLLNNIISSAINKYSPEDLMLYLMDFKGVEFNRYRGVKHTKAVLVDNSDPQMTLEVLRELKEENKKRVKLWQKEGVANIDGYNRKHPDERLPQVLFVADECQVMFSSSSLKSSAMEIQREINDIINIIATQGRSQGIHMLLATQQLDETDISGQVLKNLTECFLLMSAASDSERLVPDSSDITGKQPTGQACYYHKRELQSKVQTFYAKDEELENAIAQSQIKAFDRKSNGEAYFCGSSVYVFDTDERDAFMSSVHQFPSCSLGRNIDITNKQVLIPLRQDYSENILFFGANKEEQTVGVLMNTLMSLMLSYKQQGIWCNFIVIDCYGNSASKYSKLLNELASAGLCRLVERQRSGAVLKQLAEDISNQIATPTVLAIIGNERFAEIKRGSELINENASSFDVMGDISLDMDCVAPLGGGTLQATNIKTYPQALTYILDEGPMCGVHTLLQVDMPANIMFEGEYGKNNTDKFRHKVMLRSSNKYLTALNFSKEIDVEVLSEEEEHLRAYYYPEDGVPRLFTPYLMPESISIINE